MEGFDLSAETKRDLEMDFLAGSFPHPPKAMERLARLEVAPDVIRSRQEELRVLLENPSVYQGFKRMLPLWQGLCEPGASGALPPLQKVLRRLGELELWVRVVKSTLEAQDSYQGTGFWASLRDLARSASQKKEFTILEQELPGLRAKIQGVRAVSIGINLDSRLEPVGAVLLSVEDEAYSGRRSGLLAGLLGSQPLGELHHPPYKTLQVANQTILQDPEVHGWGVNPKSIPLFRDLSDHLSKTAQELEKSLHRFSKLEMEPWRQAAEKTAYLVLCSGILEGWKSQGVPLCFPEILPGEENLTEVRGMFHPPLLMKKLQDAEDWKTLVPNDLNWGYEGRIHIITGPNSGGKTVYLQTLGWAQVLTQIGWPLPAWEARVSPACSLGTHFQKEEETGRREGRFGEEVRRLKDLFNSLKNTGVLLMNESLSGTNALESYAIGCDLMKVLRARGARAGFTTHLHELARDAEILNSEVEGLSKLASLSAAPGTFKVGFGPPPGRSYARELAGRYGLDFESLMQA